MQRPTLRTVLLALTLAGCSADSPTDPVSPNYARHATPFAGDCELVSQPPVPISQGVVSQVDTGECNVTHLGKATYFSDKVINFVTGTQSFDGSYTAANGDILYVSGAGTNAFVGPGRVAFQAQITFEGGTGRFSDATGSATIAGEADVVNRRSQFTTSGTITY